MASNREREELHKAIWSIADDLRGSVDGWDFKQYILGKTMKDMYSSLLGIPVAGATLPVVAFLLLGIYGRNIFLIISTIVLGIGHIGIHLNHKKELE